jgi:putative zinc finger protein
VSPGQKFCCAELAGALLADYHDGALPEEARGALEAHLAVCRPCMNMVRSYCATPKIAKEIWRDTPEHCEETLLAYLKRHGAL